MRNYADVSTVLDAFHQLERGRSLARMKAAAKRLRSFDPTNEILSELESKIAVTASSCPDTANGKLGRLATDHSGDSATLN